MRKVALVFVLAILLPSLVLAWLAVRSLRDQQFLLERQQSLLCQHVTDSLAQNISDYLAQQQQDFAAQVESLTANQNARTIATDFDNQICARWPLAEVGFCVTLDGKILAPPPNARPAAQMFRLDNSGFLGNREVVEVYANSARYSGLNSSQSQSFAVNNSISSGFGGGQKSFALSPAAENSTTDKIQSPQRKILAADAVAKAESPNPAGSAAATADAAVNGLPASDTLQVNSLIPAAPAGAQSQGTVNYKAAETRKVSPQNAVLSGTIGDAPKDIPADAQKNLSRVVPAEAEFAQLIGNETDGMLARFLQNKLKLMFWHRLNREPDLIFGAQLDLNRVVNDLRPLIQSDPDLRDEICLALLDDNAKPVARSHASFSANWKRPFVATEIGDVLPHWEIAAYLVDPKQLTRAVCVTNAIIGLLITVLVLAIVIGSWAIVRNLNTELTLARQKSDFVSNVSHELKTPLTSIRMFSELLAEGRVADVAKQRSYLQIITAEAARLTRLINNVLDFSRMESGDKKYNFQPCDLTEIARTTAETFRPHLEANGFQFICEWPENKITVRGDADALAQIIVNLISNAEKYSGSAKEIILQLSQKTTPLPHAEIKVLDRGSGIPRGSEEKIFEKFYRAHDSLSSGVQGSGLGLTIARQIARAHGGDVVNESRVGGGSCFVLRIPISPSAA